MSSKRVALIGFRHEAMISCPFLTDPSTTHIHRGGEMRQVSYSPASGALARLDEEEGFEAVPLLVARTLPGGPFERSFYEAIKSESLVLLKEQGPFDGIIVLNHGAAEVDGFNIHGDTDYILAIRALVGPEVPIAVPFDMHGQVTPEILDAITVLSCLRTAPHRDYFETSYRAADQLIRVMKESLSPKKAAVRIPILIPGEMAMTAYSPTKELFAKLAEYDARPGVMEAHLFIGFGWNDRPWAGMEAVVVCEGDQELAVRYAKELAGEVWAHRKGFALYMETAGVREGLVRAAEADCGPVYLSDSGDNVTAGAGGDLTFVLQEALDLGLSDIVVGGIYAPDIVGTCRNARAGSQVRLDLGRHVTATPKPRSVEAILEAYGESLDTSRYPDLRGSQAPWCRVRIDGVIATFHAARVGLTGLGHFKAMGISPTEHKIYVVKLGYLHPQIEDVAHRHICLISEGVGDLDYRRLPYSRVIRPVYPLDADMEWSAELGLFPVERSRLSA
jgi:microcystin degradation protein MlrC